MTKRASLWGYLILAAVSTSLLTGCGDGGAPVSTKHGPIAVSLTTDKTRYAVGEPVDFTFTVTNTSSRAIQYTTSQPEFDAEVVFGDSDPFAASTFIWQFSEGMTFAPGDEDRTLAPEQTLTFHSTWLQNHNLPDHNSPSTGPLSIRVRWNARSIKIDGVALPPGPVLIQSLKPFVIGPGS